LHDAIEAYRQQVQRDYLDPTAGTLTDNGKTKIDQLKTIITYIPNLDLGALDYLGTDELFAIFRRRPASKRYGKPMSQKKNGGTGRRAIGKEDYQAKGVMFLPPKAHFSHLLALPEGENIGKAINEAMKAVEAENEELKGVLPKS
jgi:hypothetical protein